MQPTQRAILPPGSMISQNLGLAHENISRMIDNTSSKGMSYITLDQGTRWPQKWINSTTDIADQNVYI